MCSLIIGGLKYMFEDLFIGPLIVKYKYGWISYRRLCESHSYLVGVLYIVNDKALNMNSCILIIDIFLAKETFDTNNTPIIYTLRLY